MNSGETTESGTMPRSDAGRPVPNPAAASLLARVCSSWDGPPAVVIVTDRDGAILCRDELGDQVLVPVLPQGLTVESWCRSAIRPAECCLDLMQRAESRPWESHSAMVRSNDERLSDGRLTVNATFGQQHNLMLWVLEDLSNVPYADRTDVQAEKLRALGRLVGGLSHEFNNLLTVILGNLSLLRMDPAAVSSAHLPVIDAAESAASRTNRLLRDLRQFSLRSNPECTAQELGGLLRSAGNLIRETMPPSLEVNLVLPEEPIWIRTHAGMLEDCLIRLALNSRDAVESGAGVLTLSCSAESRMGGGRIMMKDNGRGISNDQLPLVIEPFFTTKPPEKTAGLGLSIVHAIAEDIGARLTIDSTPGEGTTILIDLPPADQIPPTAAPAPNHRLPPVSRPVRVLMVDNEDLVRSVGAGMLRLLGHSADACASGPEALEALTQRRFDVVILDASMPQLSGRETLDALRSAGHLVPVIICSGTPIDLNSFGTLPPPAAALSKPFTLDALQAAIDVALADEVGD